MHKAFGFDLYENICDLLLITCDTQGKRKEWVEEICSLTRQNTSGDKAES